ncbi:hemocyte protein-glutamine gamma-glutamyltransferase-like [Anthonomus grandis grandis]|uniref:hemocyte protein-glutamine gamma-glutamyltransferase-like n=1 Tax=Anthonomus grandis grandis TaxID=2921223 RepID=UPI0021661FC9|nr:hemocyte protein-glutamine gamma-glutamyltransferase-like [Anthonomus grandis grandis]XP_050294066.1 hemocyte protein-glutamine gamma-glutamyltransferase-like [Anthonomus grandis grandis]
MEPIVPIATEFYSKENAKISHTDMYQLLDNEEDESVILRRGTNFIFAIRFDRDFMPEQDVVRVRFAIGPTPNISKGTRVILPISAKKRHLPKELNYWSICLQSIQGNVITVQVNISPYAPIGIWKCSLQTNIAGTKGRRVDYDIPHDIYVLFNPWCPLDGVYMENEVERQEYVLNESGKIWCGTFKQPTGKHWVFGQFNESVLPASIFLLEKSELPHSQRGNPVLVTRSLSALINSRDDNGLLEGCWDGVYANGTSPFSWTGSFAIMEEYLLSGGKPVKYGQCWVFSGTTVTICRSLGIPCRSTTNYVSAHDTDCSMTIDKYFDIFGNLITDSELINCADKCWNFHVWNDVWMARPDLPPGYGGWQVIDATPQETSDRVYRCGPASVSAIKKGEVGFLYDTPFVFSEVNADVVHFKEDEDSESGFTKSSLNKYHVGRKIVTKHVGPTDHNGDSDMYDITDDFKNRENTREERMAVLNAIRGVPAAQNIYDLPLEDSNDVFLDLVDIDAVPIGQSFDVTVIIENKSAEERNVSMVLNASSVLYNGIMAKEIKKARKIIKVLPGARETFKVTVQPEDYLDKLVEQGLIKIYALATVDETKQTWSEEDDFTMTLPTVTINLPEVVGVNEACDVQFSFTNPLNMPLTQCTYTIEGPGLQMPKSHKYRTVMPQETVTLQHTFKAKKAGERNIVISFTSSEIRNINASKSIRIQN